MGRNSWIKSVTSLWNIWVKTLPHSEESRSSWKHAHVTWWESRLKFSSQQAVPPPSGKRVQLQKVCVCVCGKSNWPSGRNQQQLLASHLSSASLAVYRTGGYEDVLLIPGFLPALHHLHGRCFQQPVRQQVDFLHDVGQSDGQLLPQEDKRRLLAGVDGPWIIGKINTDQEYSDIFDDLKLESLLSGKITIIIVVKLIFLHDFRLNAG